MVERLGRYVVLKHLASGGMADVLLARTDGIEGFERHVVLKRIKSEHAKDRRFIDMFLDEARLAANLHHTNVVQVHDIGEASGEYFFAMEYLHGEDLRAMLKQLAKTKSHMPLPHVVSIISAAAAGLHHAHERKGPDKKPLNIVHRDVSPSNILVGYDGSVKVVDFGIAKATRRQGETHSGSLKGKVSYMSPEQCKSMPIDRRSDVYALGVVLYELATTTRLFKSDSDYLVMDAICTGKIPLPRVRRPGLPNELSTIIMTALATDPDRRYQTAEELRAALDQFSELQGHTSNSGSLAGYLKKLLGERPEPWLDIDESEPEVVGQADTRAMRGRSYTDLPLPAPDATSIGTGSGVRAARGEGVAKPATVSASSLASVASIEPTKPPRLDDRTSQRMAWEHAGALPPAPAPAARTTPAKIAMVAVPALLLAGLGVWKLGAGGKPTAQPAAAVATGPVEPGNAPAIERTIEPITDGAKIGGATNNAASPDHAKSEVATSEAAKADEQVKSEAAKSGAAKADAAKQELAKAEVARREAGKQQVAKSEAAKAAAAKADLAKADTSKSAAAKADAARKAELAKQELAKSEAAQAAATKDAAQKAELARQELAKSEAAKAELAKAEALKAELAKAETTRKAELAKAEAAKVAAANAPPTIERQMARLSGASVEGVASQHRAALSKCEGTAELHGDITVRFEINAAGRVVKSQVNSTVKNPKVSGCILGVIKGWQFPKPPANGAEGTYSMNYQ